MENFSNKNSMEYENIITESPQRITFKQVWQNQPPVLNWYLGLSCLSFGFIYMLLFTML